jgi:hypothetical protein
MTTPAATDIRPSPRDEEASGVVERRLVRTRALARKDPAAAQSETWGWFVDAGRRIQSDRDAALSELDELFRSGAPSAGIDGRTRGTLVGFTLHPLFDRAMAAITTLWLPWAGKRFEAGSDRGDNLLLHSARWPSKLLWPLYGMRDASDRLAAFDFETRVERGAVDPDRDVLVIDYAPVDSNPALIIRQIRDELVEIVPGAHLGKMLWRRGSGDDASYSLLAYFALRTPPSD